MNNIYCKGFGIIFRGPIVEDPCWLRMARSFAQRGVAWGTVSIAYDLLV